MQTKTIALIGLLLIPLMAIGPWGCNPSNMIFFGPAAQVPLGCLEITIELPELVTSQTDYQPYFCGPVYNPSAVLFVPKKSPYTLKLNKKWKPISSTSHLNDLLARLKENKAELQAISWPIEGKRVLLAFIYTPAYASLRPTAKPKTFVLRAIPELFNPIYHGGDDRLLEGGTPSMP